MSERIVSVAVPVAVDRGFTYRVPDDWPIAPSAGSRVLVPFGQRLLVGLVRPVNPPDEGRRLKPLTELLDPPQQPTLVPDLVRLCEWMEDYYVAPVGEVYRLALPGLLTNVDARLVRVSEAGCAALAAAGGGPLLNRGLPEIGREERRVLELLVDAPPAGLPVSRLTAVRPRIPGVLGVVAELERRKLCETWWGDADVGRTEPCYRRTGYLQGAGADEDRIQESVGRSKQRRAILDYLESQGGDGWVALSELRGPFPRARQLLAPLIASKLVTSETRPRALDPFATGVPEPTEAQLPTSDQRDALETLTTDLDARSFSAALLHGITGSGKTEVYLQLIARARAQGRGAIVLVPEIALTPQLADRFRARFGDEIAVLHSGLTPRQRLDAWHQIRSGKRPIAIGPRSAVFAPISDLAVIVVDEEHDPSFKQEDGVRYHARDVALVRGRDCGAVVVLGSATPSLETYEHARNGRFRWLRLRNRPTDRPLPEVELVCLSVHRPDPESLLTARLRNAVADTVTAGEQAILFLNRRGFTTSLQCAACGHLQSCPDCSAPSLTFHLVRSRLLCHLCGHIEAVPSRCGDCGSEDLVHAGVGTERLEVALARDLPGIRVLRLDRDTSRGQRLLDTLAKFRRREADVLVGTQMLSKGHDFPDVTLVGVLRGDHGLALPDPRAAERTFQLLTQVSGRAGRGSRPGRVLVQAYAIHHPAIEFAAKHDFVGFAAVELELRRQLGNPPHGYLVLVRVTGFADEAVQRRASDLAGELGHLARAVARAQQVNADRVELLGPVPSPISRINRRSRFQILLRCRDRAPLRWILRKIRPSLGSTGGGTEETLAVLDVDPQSLL